LTYPVGGGRGECVACPGARQETESATTQAMQNSKAKRAERNRAGC